MTGSSSLNTGVGGGGIGRMLGVGGGRECVKGLDGFHFVGRCILDASNGSS